MEIIEYNSLEKCAEVIRDFQERENVNIFLTYEWMVLWKKYFAPNDGERILVFKEQEETIGFLPLVYHKHQFLGVTIYRFFGTGKSNYICLPSKKGREAELYNEVFSYFSNLKDKILLRIDDINDSSVDYKILCNKSEGKQFYQYACPYVKIECTWDEFFKSHFSKGKRRSKLKSFETKLERLGKVRFIRINNQQSYEENKELIEQTFNIHRLRFSKVMNSSHYSDEKFSDFYRNIFGVFSEKKLLEMSLLCIDGIVISFILAFRIRNTLIHYIPAFNTAFKHYSLGHVHLMKLFRCIAVDNTVSYFDFSKGDAIYKERWADGITSNYSFIFGFGRSTLTWLIKFIVSQATALKLYGRKRNWNTKIKKIIGSLKYKKNKERTTESRIVPCKVDTWNSAVETKYSFKTLISLPIEIQTFVLEQIYYGKQPSFLCKDQKIVGIKIRDNEQEDIYRII